MKKRDPQINPDGPLCTAWELADISVKLGTLLGLGKPAKEEALELMDWASSHSQTVRSRTTFAKRHSDIESAEAAKARIPYAKEINEPTSFPIGMDEFVKIISSSHDKKRRDTWRLKFGKRHFERAFNRKAQDDGDVRNYLEEIGLGDSGGIGNSAAFWHIVEEFTPIIPRLRKLANALERSG